MSCFGPGWEVNEDNLLLRPYGKQLLAWVLETSSGVEGVRCLCGSCGVAGFGVEELKA